MKINEILKKLEKHKNNKNHLFVYIDNGSFFVMSEGLVNTEARFRDKVKRHIKGVENGED